MEGIYSNIVQNVVRFSRDEAIRLGKNYIGAEHLLLGLIKEGEGVAVKILENLKIDLLDLKQKIEESTFPKVSVTQKDIMPLTMQAEKVMKISYLEAKISKSHVIETEHLLLSIMKGDNSAAQILDQYGVTYELVQEELWKINHGGATGTINYYN